MKNLTHFASKGDAVKKGVHGKLRPCALCRQPFSADSKYSLFCEGCKEHNDRYRFAEWLSA